jgi:hypothetical protein
LPSHKKIFATFEEATDFLKKVVDKRQKWVNEKYLMRSFRVLSIDTESFPEYQRIFKESVKPLLVRRPTLSERGLRKPKKKPQSED